MLPGVAMLYSARDRHGMRRLQGQRRGERLNKCPICFKWVCDNCAAREPSAAIFCSKRCADQFFFGDDDDDDLRRSRVTVARP